MLDFADEQSVVQTVFATTTLMLLRASLGESLDDVIAETEGVLAAAPDPALEQAPQFTFVGQGWAHGVAREAALKMREAAQSWTESYPQMEYRHGPISIAEPGRVVWVFGEPVPGLLDDVAATGATVVCDDLDPVSDLVRVQRLAVSLAEAARARPRPAAPPEPLGRARRADDPLRRARARRGTSPTASIASREHATNRRTPCRARAGGKAVNVARVLHALGEDGQRRGAGRRTDR